MAQRRGGRRYWEGWGTGQEKGTHSPPSHALATCSIVTVMLARILFSAKGQVQDRKQLKQQRGWMEVGMCLRGDNASSF